MDWGTAQGLAERRWARTDRVLHRLSRANPLGPPQISAPDGFAALVGSIVHQQVSLAAGRTIHARLVAAVGGRLVPRRVLEAGEERLRAAGLSRPKAGYVLDLADRADRGALDFRALEEAPDGEVVAALTQVRGVGVWTAKMFLIFHLHRPDVLAPEDLGLRLAVREAYGVEPEAAAGFMEERRPAWSPWCSVAARVLWASRRAAMARGQAVAGAPSAPAAAAPTPRSPRRAAAGARGR